MGGKRTKKAGNGKPLGVSEGEGMKVSRHASSPTKDSSTVLGIPAVSFIRHSSVWMASCLADASDYRVGFAM